MVERWVSRSEALPTCLLAARLAEEVIGLVIALILLRRFAKSVNVSFFAVVPKNVDEAK